MCNFFSWLPISVKNCGDDAELYVNEDINLVYSSIIPVDSD